MTACARLGLFILSSCIRRHFISPLTCRCWLRIMFLHLLTQENSNDHTLNFEDTLRSQSRSVSSLIRSSRSSLDVVQHTHEVDPSLKLRWRDSFSSILFLISWRIFVDGDTSQINSSIELHRMICKIMKFFRFFALSHVIDVFVPAFIELEYSWYLPSMNAYTVAFTNYFPTDSEMNCDPIAISSFTNEMHCQYLDVYQDVTGLDFF